MPDGGITVRGISEVQAYLRNFPVKMVEGCFPRALSRAIAVFEDELRRNCPEYEPEDNQSEESTSTKEYGTLLDNLRSIVTIDSGQRGGKASVGFSRKGFVALILEFGWVPARKHQVKAGGKAYVPGTGFMRRSFEVAADRAYEAFLSEVRAYVERA